MKKVFQKVKNFFKGVFDAIDKRTNNDGYTAFLIFMFYVSLTIAAIIFISGVFQAMSTIGSILMIFGSYFSVMIIYNFIKDFVGLIKFYLESKKEVEKESEDNGE